MPSPRRRTRSGLLLAALVFLLSALPAAAAADDEVARAFEVVAITIESLKAELASFASDVQALRWFPCESGLGWYDHTYLWRPWQATCHATGCTPRTWADSTAPRQQHLQQSQLQQHLVQSPFAVDVAFKRNVESAAACLREALASSFQVTGPAACTLGTTLGFGPLRRAFIQTGHRVALRQAG